VLRSPALLRTFRGLTQAALLLAGLAACEKPRPLAVRVSIPGPDSLETPVTGVGLVALPYDRDSVLRSLEQRARTPRPPTAAIESLFAAFRGPFAAYSSATIRLGHLKDSLSRDAPAYAQHYAVFNRLTDSLRVAQARADQARVALDRERRRFSERGDSLRLRMRQWEDSTYQGYDSLVQGLARRAGREPVTDTTGADGWAHLTLRPGRWWIYARSWDATDPNAEWYWNVPAPAGDTLLLSSRTARRQPRY
jgi:hypothetical protein